MTMSIGVYGLSPSKFQLFDGFDKVILNGRLKSQPKHAFIHETHKSASLYAATLVSVISDCYALNNSQKNW